MNQLFVVLLSYAALYSVMQIVVRAIACRKARGLFAAPLPVLVFVAVLALKPQSEGGLFSSLGPALLVSAVLWQLGMVTIIAARCVRRTFPRR